MSIDYGILKYHSLYIILHIYYSFVDEILKGMNMSDILDLMDDSTPVPKEDIINDKENTVKPIAKKKKNNLWENPDIEGKKVDTESLMRFNRMVTFISLVEDIDESILTKAADIASELNQLGFTHRYSGDKVDKLGKAVSAIFNGREQIYLPWKSFNKDIQGTLNKATDCAYYHCAYYHKAFKKLPNSVRAINARYVNMALGEECNTALNLLIVYTPDGAETTNEVDYKTTGFLSFIINLCNELNIPVFNLKKDDSKDRILEFIKTFK